jgi:hypothetical protein
MGIFRRDLMIDQVKQCVSSINANQSFLVSPPMFASIIVHTNSTTIPWPNTSTILMLLSMRHYGKQVLRREHRSFAESKSLWREPPLELSAKNSSPRVKKNLGEDKNSRWINSSPRAKKKLSPKNSLPRASQLALGEEILLREFFSALGEEIFKESLLHLHTFSIINMHLYKGYVQI